MTHRKEKLQFTIGHSDYNRNQIENDLCGNAWGSSLELLDIINQFEEQGYEIVFKTSILRKIFGLGIYKIIAHKQLITDIG